VGLGRTQICRRDVASWPWLSNASAPEPNIFAILRAKGGCDSLHSGDSCAVFECGAVSRTDAEVHLHGFHNAAQRYLHQT
jgi:hypothetical protein